jgi:hypothetical protein
LQGSSIECLSSGTVAPLCSEDISSDYEPGETSPESEDDADDDDDDSALQKFSPVPGCFQAANFAEESDGEFGDACRDDGVDVKVPSSDPRSSDDEACDIHSSMSR